MPIFTLRDHPEMRMANAVEAQVHLVHRRADLMIKLKLSDSGVPGILPRIPYVS